MGNVDKNNGMWHERRGKQREKLGKLEGRVRQIVGQIGYSSAESNDMK